MKRRVFSLVAFLCIGLLLTGCASRFDRAWREAGTRSPESPLAGRWDGKWRSEKHKGSGGRLRGVMISQGKDAYRAEFKANWLVFSSTYTVNFQTETRRGEVHFQGEHDLGPLFGGVYNFIGRATPDRFHASYDSSYDRGIFEMSRPVPVRD